MRVLAWSAMPSAGQYVTGVGKHIIHMINGLAERPGWHVSHLVTLDRGRDLEIGSDPYNVPTTTIPMTRRVAEFLWRSFDFPRIDHYWPSMISIIWSRDSPMVSFEAVFAGSVPSNALLNKQL
jgi:hypothetical protein